MKIVPRERTGARMQTRVRERERESENEKDDVIRLRVDGTGTVESHRCVRKVWRSSSVCVHKVSKKQP